MQCRVGICGEPAHEFGDLVGRQLVLAHVGDVVQRLAVVVGQHMDARRVERDLGQAVVGAQALEPAWVVGQQRQPRLLGAARRRYEVNLGRHETIFFVALREREHGLGDDLRRQAGDRQQDAATIAGGVVRQTHAAILPAAGASW